jgi:hypothetical protein
MKYFHFKMAERGERTDTLRRLKIFVDSKKKLLLEFLRRAMPSKCSDGNSSPRLQDSREPLGTRAARWNIFKPKIQIWAYFGGPWNGKCWYILWQFWKILQLFRIYYGHLVI